MKVKTSITLDRDVLKAVDRIAGREGSRSGVIEQAIREHLLRRAREARDARDRELLDAHAAELERETAEVLEFQAEL